MTTQLDTYVQSLLPDQYVILGVRLKPFCLGHIFLMRRFECKFSSDDPDTMGGIDDLLLAISICSRSYEGFLEFIDDTKEFAKWSKKWGKWIVKEIKRNKQYNVIDQSHLFKEYMKTGIVIPKYWEQNTDNSIKSGAHWTQSIFNVLVGHLGYTQSEALNVSVAKAFNDYYKYLETMGVVNLMRDDELELIELSKK